MNVPKNMQDCPIALVFPIKVAYFHNGLQSVNITESGIIDLLRSKHDITLSFYYSTKSANNHSPCIFMMDVDYKSTNLIFPLLFKLMHFY